jgi:hypothetical protein
MAISGLVEGAWTKFENLSAPQFRDLISKPGCSLFLPWASWCQPCLTDLPFVVSKLNELKGITPILLDMSTPFVQDSFSKSFMKNLRPKFTVYLRPAAVDDQTFPMELSSGWKGELLYAELYRSGAKAKTWRVKFNKKNFMSEIAALCK